MWTTKVLFSRSKALVVNFFFFTKSIYLIIRRTLVIVYNLHLSFQLLKLISMLLKVRKNIPKITFIVISVNRKVSLKNQDFLFLSSIEKKAITILKFFSLLPSNFWIFISVFLMQKSSFFAKSCYIIFILFFKSIKVLIKS